MINELPKKWYIVLTPDNKLDVSKWYINKYHNPNKLFSTGAAYGEINGEEQVQNLKNNASGEEITFEEFKILVLHQPKPEPEYEIY